MLIENWKSREKMYSREQKQNHEQSSKDKVPKLERLHTNSWNIPNLLLKWILQLDQRIAPNLFTVAHRTPIRNT
jgi:hypothetical protein